MMTPYAADASLAGKLRRRVVRLVHRRPSPAGPARPMVSFAFDDAPRSAFQTGAKILQDRGVRGSFFVCADLAGRDGGSGVCGGRDEALAADAAGHEIGCHTFSHLDCGRADAQTITADLDRNRDALVNWGLPPPQTFAYPYGDVAALAKQVLAKRFALSRALHHGLVTRGSDLNQAPAVGVEGDDGEPLAMRWLARVKARGGWLILITHGVEDSPTRFGTSAAVLTRLVDQTVESGLEVVTVAQGVRRLGAAS